MIGFIITIFLVSFVIVSYYVIDLTLNEDKLDGVKKRLNSLRDDSFALIKIILWSIIFLFGIYFFSTSSSFKNVLDNISEKNLGQIGDLFNGIVAPLIAVISIFFLYRAFREQLKANELFYNFELERSFKNDLEWLRDNYADIQLIQGKLENKEINDIVMFIDSAESTRLSKSIYTMNTVINILEKLDVEIRNQKRENENLSKLEIELIDIVKVLYLDSYKQVFRDFNRYLQSEINDSQKQQRLPLVINFQDKFVNLYDYIKEYDSERLFSFQLKSYSTIKNKLG